MDRVVLRHGASPKASELRKNKPHPVGLFAALSEFLNDLLIDLILCVQEANEVSIGHYTYRVNRTDVELMTRSRTEGSSFSGLLTRVEMGQIRIGSTGKGRSNSRGSG